LRFEILRRDSHTCRYCGRSAPEVKLTVDHVVPSALGGADDPGNLVTACVDCNGGKSSASPDASRVEAASASAVRWAEAIRSAAALRAARRGEMDESVLEFEEAWNFWTYDKDRVVVDAVNFPMSANWRESVERFLELGLTVDELIRASHISIANRKIYTSDKFAYFCGICWKEIERLQELAAKIADDAVEKPEPEPSLADLP
jgi:hypothetical protein